MAPSRASTPPLECAVSDLTLAVGQLLRRLRSANPGGLNLSQSGVLARLEREGPMTTADLARAEMMKPQSMKTILAGLQEEACVEREPHPTDRRQILFAITRKGVDERKQRTAAKREWLLAKLEQFDSQDVATLAAAIPLIRRLGDSTLS
ncbi:marR family protein [Paraburkholderia xenovorans LB400]|uniref:Transcriptional regulator, MarR family n=1 Tax=Paraburkholderia xenovorans (strain LB400) TaxID=266265 RepID=Q13H18_PARXL|nr:MarR family transcriptional regulator [Paraburkholderia xenovorans]ABE36621.1 transcriptional regulator, MarR family [Paraburkholderia xenovorans LB400]AIP34232.1 marR family protein [Paraburkholderia xenovorans LB400]